MFTKRFLKGFGLLLVVALLAAVLPLQAKAQTGGNTLNVADWSDPAAVGVTGRGTVLKDGETYHMWYYATDSKLYHTSSTTPGSFGAGTEVTFTGDAPVEKNSISVVKEGDTYYMIAYGVDNTEFAYYTSPNGTAWTKGGVVFDGTGVIADFGKVDAPFLFKLDSGYRLYFQVKNAAGTRYDIYAAESEMIGGTYKLVNSNQPVLSPGDSTAWDGAFVMHPWVVKDGDVYYMWYSAHNGTDPHRLGMAKSTDGLNWVKSPANPILPDPTAGYAEPSVIKDGNTWRMWLIARAGAVVPSGDGVVYYEAAGPFEFQSIQDAIDAASAGDTILVNGTFVHTGTATFNKDVTLTCATGAKIQVSGTGESFKLQAGASIEGCEIEKTDKTDQHNIITLEASGVAVKNNRIHGQWAIGDNEVSRAMVVYAGTNTGLEISGNQIWGLRQPAYISGTNTGTVSNNYVHGTKGWVIEGGNLTFSGNTFAGNVGDIAILSLVPSEYYTDILALSAANDNAVVEDQRVTPAVLSVAYVDDSAVAGGNGTEASPYQSIQAGINRVIAGGTVNVANGTYVEPLAIYKSLNLVGESQAGVIIDASASTGYGMDVLGDNLTTSFSNFTLKGPSTSTVGYGMKIDGEYAVTNITNVMVKDSYRSNIDLNGLNGGTLTNITVTGSTHGVGLALSNSSNITVTGITTSNNAWGGIAIYTDSTVHQQGADKITINGTNSFGESVKLYTEIDPAYPVTNLTAPDFAYIVKNAVDRANFTFYATDILNAQTIALGMPNPLSSTIMKLADGSFYVYPGMSIQAAIDTASAGNTINVAAGTYTEQLTITKDIDLVGADKATTIIKAPADLPAASESGSAIILVSGSGVEAEVTGFTISGPGPSGCGSIRAGIYVYDSAFANIHGNNIIDIRDSGATISGCQNGIGIAVGRQASSTSGTATIANNTISGYQKGGIVVDNTDSNATITGNTITGAGTTSITAQNGIQISRGATATISGNAVSGNSYHSEGSTWDWGATGVLLYQSGDVQFTGANNFTGNDTHLYIEEAGTVSVGAETFGALSDAPIGSGYFVINYNDATLNLTASTFPTTDPFVIAERIWDGIDEAGLGLARWAVGHVYVNPEGSIQRAIDLATAGDTIHVAAGTYMETLTINKALTLLGPNAGINPITGTRVAEAVISYPAGIVADKDLVSVSADNVTIDGFTLDGKDLAAGLWGEGIYSEGNNLTVKNNIVKNFRQIGVRAGAAYGGPYYTGALIENNKVTSDVSGIYFTYSGIYLQGTQGTVKGNYVDSAHRGVQIQPYANPATNQGVVENNTFIAYRSPLYFNYSNHENSKWVFRNNIAQGIASLEGAPLDYWSGIVIETFYKGEVLFERNQVLLGTANATANYLYYERGTVTGTRSATPNWWGSALGPAAGKISGTVQYDPWCGDAECSFTVSNTPPDEEEGGFYIDEEGQLVVTGDVSVPGGIEINEPGLTVVLESDAEIENHSPCFVVNASYTKIYAEPGAKCIPTDSSNGIDVAAGLTDIRVARLEIDGTDQTTGDGIHFAGVVNGTVLVDNKIHDLGGDGIEFVDSPTGTVDIHGNLFAFNGGVGINNSDTTSPTSVAAEYNSWGSYYGPTGEGGDGVSANVDYAPYTYGDFWMSSSGSPWVDQVVKGQTITYTIKALVKEVNSADVTFTYPEGLIVDDYEALTTKFESGELEHDTVTRTFTYIGMSTNGNENETVDLFSVTFEADQTMRDVLMNIVDGNFGMGGVGSSSNVYVQSIDDGKITVIDLPTISSTDITGPYLAGVSREFHVTAENPATGGNFAHVLFNYRITNAVIADIAQFQYKAGDQWFNMPLEQDGLDLVGYFGPSSGFPMGPSYTATTTFRITFKTVKSYPFTLTLNDLDASSEELAKLEATAIVNGNFAITGTFTMQGNLNRGGIPVTLTWTGTGWTYAASANTVDELVNNFQVTVTYGGGYRITTNQPRYLNLTTASNKTITVDGVETLAALMLRGGNVVNADTSLDKIDLSDAGLIGGVYGSSGDPSLTPADANFDGRVNILDLALVGGNYLMESATAYSGWVPLP